MSKQSADDIKSAAPSDDSRLEVSAKILNFEPGLYSVEITAPRIVRGASGMTVPCIRLDPINVGEQTRAFVSSLSESALILPNDPSSYLRIRGGTASVLLTVYKLAGAMAPPELRISMIQQAAARGSAPVPEPALTSEALKLLAHVERAGDVVVQGGVWVGQPGSRGAIEGFSVLAGGGIDPEDIEYQAILGSDWTTPWYSNGEFCGSRGLSLPLLGVRIRLRGETAKSHALSYWGSFVGVGEVGPIEGGAVCGGSGAPLEALRVVLKRRQAAPSAVAASKAAFSPAAAAPAKAKDAKMRTLAPAEPVPNKPKPKADATKGKLPEKPSSLRSKFRRS